VEGLPRAHRELIEARLDGQTQYDVADAKGVSHQAVSQMERKAVERLREAMGVE
jgi:DNA-directed RNA polymerase specialized sigma subunit